MMASYLLALLSLLVLLKAETTLADQEKPLKGGYAIQRLLTVAKSEQIINDDQFSRLLDLASRLRGGAEDVGTAKYDNGLVGGEFEQESIFFKIYNQFTLLNVVYVSGALLIMGAYTLFMTIAYETFNYWGLSVIMLFQVGLFGGVGMYFWGNDDYQFVGGLFCTISTSMVPFLVYNLQRALGVWPRNHDPGIFQGFTVWIRPEWVVMEIVAVVVGLFFLSYVRFPFLLLPVSFFLWFLSMDLAPLYPGFERLGWKKSFEVRRRVSISVGISMMIAGFVFEQTLGSHPDMGFWLYLFGTFTFWCTLNFNFPVSDLYGSLFLLINIGLVLIGSHLDRTTFHVFGTIGVIEYVVGVLYNHIKTTSSVVLWLLKALAAAALFSQAIRREGNLEILGALVCTIAFNFNYIGFVTSGEHYSLLLLVTNLGFVSTAAVFSRPLSLWLFTIPDTGLIVSLLCSILVATYHLQLPVKYLSNPPNTIFAYLYNGYRLLASVGIAFVFVFLRQPHFAWVGGLGIPLIAVNFSPVLRVFVKRGHTSSDFHTYRGLKGVVYSSVTFTVLLFGVAFSTYLQSNLLYLICCVFMLVSVMCHLDKWKILGCIFAVFLIVLSVPLQSSFLITIGAIYIFGYLAYLAYNAFRDSLLFPLALILLGLVMIYIGVMYQRYESIIHQVFYSFLPGPVSVLLTQTISTVWQEGGTLDWYHFVRQATFSFDSLLTFPGSWVMWPGALTFALVDGPAPYVSVVCGVAIVVLILSAFFLSYRQSLVEDLDDSIKVSDITFTLSQDPTHENHGIVIKVKGTKARQIEKPLHLALTVDGTSFWHTASNVFGEFAVSLARSMILPYKLTPHLITFTGFTKGKTDFTSQILLGTGHKGSQRMKHITAQNAIKKLHSSNHQAMMKCVVVYSNSWYKPWSKLCVKEIKIEDIKNQLV